MLIFKQFTFDSAHFLPMVEDGHKCKGIHGHTYKLTVFIEGSPNNKEGWIIDFAVVKEVLSPIIDEVDHKMLNDIKGLENPTCEIFSIWLWDRIKEHIPSLSRIELHETATSGAIYEGK